MPDQLPARVTPSSVIARAVGSEAAKERSRSRSEGLAGRPERISAWWTAEYQSTAAEPRGLSRMRSGLGATLGIGVATLVTLLTRSTSPESASTASAKDCEGAV